MQVGKREGYFKRLVMDLKPGREKQKVPPSAGTPIDKTCKEISSALARRLGNLPGINANAMLSIKIEKNDDVGAQIKFTVFGVRTDAGAKRKHKSLHTVSISFAPTGNAYSNSENEFDTAFEQLQPLLGDTGSDYSVKEAAIDLDFSITEEGNMSILAAGEVKDESTHHLAVKLTSRTRGDSCTNRGA
jgi:hypothetical protein